MEPDCKYETRCFRSGPSPRFLAELVVVGGDGGVVTVHVGVYAAVRGGIVVDHTVPFMLCSFSLKAKWGTRNMSVAANVPEALRFPPTRIGIHTRHK